MYRNKVQTGFTIVELLIVIVVIGILAGITILAYNGITQRAVISKLSSDLQSNATQLQLDQVTNSAYPGSTAAANNGAGLKTSAGTTYQYSVDNSVSPQTFCLTATSGSTAYYITNDGVPTSGVCPGHTAPGAIAVNGGVVTTFAGGAVFGYIDGTGAGAGFSGPIAIASDSAGTLYVADDDRIRKITPAGVVTTLAGSTPGYADGTGAGAQFNNISGIAVDDAGNVYVGDRDNHRIRKVTSAGVVTTLAGSTSGYTDATGASAQFWGPSSVAVDGSGNVFVADANNNRIRKVTSAGVVTTLAGSSYGLVNATGASAQFRYPYGVTVDSAGNVYVGDVDNSLIRKVTSAGVVTTLAGGTYGSADGTGASAQFRGPYGVAVDGAGIVYVADFDIGAIRKIQ